MWIRSFFDGSDYFLGAGKTAEIEPRLPGVIAGGNVGEGGCRVLHENVLAGSKEGKSGMYYVPLLWKGIIFFMPWG
jgi:hypothetical protein